MRQALIGLGLWVLNAVVWYKLGEAMGEQQGRKDTLALYQGERKLRR